MPLRAGATGAPQPDAALVQELCNGARGLLAADEWEQRLGGLRLARVLVQRGLVRGLMAGKGC